MVATRSAAKKTRSYPECTLSFKQDDAIGKGELVVEQREVVQGF